MTEVASLLAAGTPVELDQLAGLLDHPLWRPMSLPQLEALLSPADVTGYGGAAGGGKTDWLLGLALTQHRRAILYRREATQLEGLEERALELIGERARYNATKRVWRLDGDRLLRFGAVKEPDSWKKYAGQGFDLIGFDEATHFLADQVRTLMTWNRTADAGQRCRVCLGFNPPTRPEEEWIVGFFAPWLDPHHPNPARPGELRWFAEANEGEIELPDGTPIEHGGRIVRPRSRTFIPARVEDNPFLTATGYVDVLNALPEPLRSLVPKGKSTTVQVTDTCGMLETYFEVDKALADLNGNTAQFRLGEGRAFMEGLSQQMAQTILYGNTQTNPERFLGLAPRYNSLSAANAENIVDAGGTGSDNTSIWLVVWGPDTCHGIFPKGSKAGFQHKDLGEVTLEDGAGGQFQGYRDHFKWDMGLSLRDWRFVVRIANIDVSNLSSDLTYLKSLIGFLIEAEERVPSLTSGRAAFYGNRTVRTALRKAILEKVANNLTQETVGGKIVTAFDGIPFRRIDQILNAEARVV